MHAMHVDRLDLNLLVALRALLAERHVTRAAKRVGLTQPAMSHALGRLRKELGDPILVRTAKGMQPTARAEALAAPLERALDELARVLEPPEAFDAANAKRRFLIGTSDYVELVMLPQLCEAVWKEAPGVDLRVVNFTGRADDELASGAIDLLITLDGLPRDESTIRKQALFSDSFVCVVRDDHPFAKRRLSLDDFAALPHLLVAPRGEEGGGAVDQALAKHGKKRRIALQTPHFLVAPHALLTSDLVITLAARVAAVLAPALGLRRIAPPPELALEDFRMAMNWHERRHRDPANQWLRRIVADVSRAL